MTDTEHFNLENPEIFEEPPLSKWLFARKHAAWIWLVVRLWLGYEWMKAGYSKLWGGEKQAFWNTGLGVKAYTTNAIAQHGVPHGPVVYGWWVQFLRDFVLPNYSWIAKLVGIGEFLIGIALIVGFATGIAAVFGLALNFTYVLSGTVSTNPVFIIAGIFIVLAWRNAGYLGLDRYLLPQMGVPGKPGKLFVNDHEHESRTHHLV